MKFGLTQSEIELLRSLALDPLKRQGARVWLFGSRARGDYKPFSDIDLLYEVPEGVLLPAGVLGRIEEELEDSNLPYKVDIVNLDEIASSYRDGILADRIPV